MKQNTLKLAGLAFATAIATISAKADIPVHQNVSLYGYAAGSLSYNKPDSLNSDTSLDLDAAKIGLAFNFAPVTAKVSLYTDKGASDLYLLEANATYDVGNGLTVTGGRFQSWIGYEAFDIPNANFITKGTDVLSFIIPNFHEGVKVEYTSGKSTFGVAFVDSIFNTNAGSNPKYRGDGKLSDGYGVEGRYGFNDGALSINATLAYQNQRYLGVPSNRVDTDTYIADVWAQYVVKKTTFGGELYYSYNDSVNNYFNTWFGLVMVKQQLNDKLSVAGRFSAGKYDASNFWKVSAQPAYAITQNLTVGAEVNYSKYDKDFQNAKWTTKDNFYAGVLAVFHF